MSDAAVFYSALSPATIQALYLAGAGEAITYTQNPDGSVTLNWVEGTLQRAATANGPWSNVTTTSPSYTTSAGGIYRVAR
jgi:hypothetical protein